MKRHISIFALLLCAFAAAGKDLSRYYVAANVECEIQRRVGRSSNTWSFRTLNSTSGGYYDQDHSENSFTSIVIPDNRDADITAVDLDKHRFLGWYSKTGGWGSTLANATVATAVDRISESKTLTDANVIADAGSAGGAGIPVVFAKYVKVWTITTGVDPAGAGTVSISGTNILGTVDDGGIVMLTATANKGYEFSKWSDDNTTNPRTISGVTADATYTAVFTKKVNAIISGPTIANWTYGDTAKTPSASAQYTGSTRMTYTYYNSSKTSLGSSPPTNAGTYYVKATSPSSDEYVSATSDYVQFSISKKTISTTGAGFSDKSVTYDGTAKTITASSIPEGVAVTYSNNSRTASGSQTATVNFAATDKENCTVSPTSKTATLTVNQATISAIALSATSATYDGQPHQPTVVSVTANGKTFTDAAIGWDVSYDKADFTSVGTIKVTANGKKNLTGSASGTFEIKSKSITVTFDANGGNAPSQASKTVQYPGTYGTLATCTRKGYDFTGWWTAKEGGTQITEATSVESTASQTLFAHWEAKKYTLTIALREGESYGEYKGPQNYQLPDPLIFGETNLNEIAVAYKKDDADFQGYFTSGGAMVYDAQGRNVMGALGEYWTNNYPIGTYCYDGNLALSARFADPKEHYQVTVTASPEEAGTVDPSGTATYVEDSKIVLKATANAGYSFSCWTNGTGAVVSTDKEYPLTVTADATYTAVFTGKTYTVTFYGNGGDPDEQVCAYTHGSTYGEFPKVDRNGYDFVGWFTSAGKSGTLVTEDERFLNVDDYGELFAHWTEKTEFTGTFIDPSGTNKTVVVEGLTKGQPVPANKVPDFKRAGYQFNGWNPALPTTVSGDFTTFAQWMSLASVLDCEGTLWFAIDDNSAWFVDSTDCTQGGTSLRADGPRAGGSGRLTTSVSEPGTMTFWWKGDAGTVLSVKSETDRFFGSFSGSAGMGWTPCKITIDKASSVIFYCAETGGFGGRCSVDCFTWTPGIEPVKYEVTFTDPSKTFTNETYWVEDGGTAVAPDWDRKTDKFESLAWSKPLSPITGIVTNEAVWTCRVEFVDREGGNSPVTNKVGYGQSVVAPTTFTPPADKHFGGWDPSVPDAIESNSVFTVVWTDNPTYTVTYSWDKETPQTDTKRQGVPLTLKGAIFTRAGYEQDGWSKNPDGSVKDFELGPVGIYSDDADLTLYPTWKELKPVVVDEIARALDCEDSGLTFEVAGRWSVFTNESFAQEGPSCLSNKVAGSTLTTTITESGTLTFWWKAKYHPSLNFLCTTNNKEATKFTMRSQDKEMWRSAELPINASQGDVILVFRAQNSGYYTALDHFTWTPDRKEPEYADTDTPVTGFSMSDGKLGFSFAGDGSTYHLLGTNDLVAPMPWPMVFETNKASGTILFDIPVKADEPKMFYRIRALQ